MKHLTMTELLGYEIKAEKLIYELQANRHDGLRTVESVEVDIAEAKEALLKIRKEISSRDGQPYENPFKTK